MVNGKFNNKIKGVIQRRTETTSCINQESERLKQDAIDKTHRESMCDYIKIPKIAFFYDTIYLLYLFKLLLFSFHYDKNQFCKGYNLSRFLMKVILI